jgi:hypothetical protein
MAISTASTADPPVFNTFMPSRAALGYLSKVCESERGTNSLVAGGKMQILIGHAVVAGARVYENTGSVTEFPPSPV